jgi:hypothetical protein
MQTIDNFCSHLSKTTIQKLVSPSPAAQDSLTNETGINKASSDQFYRLQVDIIIHQDQARLQEATPRACPTLEPMKQRQVGYKMKVPATAAVIALQAK